VLRLSLLFCTDASLDEADNITMKDQSEVTTDVSVVSDTKTDVPPRGIDEVLSFCSPPWGRDTPFPLFLLSIHFLIFTIFFLFPLSFLIRFIFFLLLSTRSLSTRIATLRFQVGVHMKRPNLSLFCLCLLCAICIS